MRRGVLWLATMLAATAMGSATARASVVLNEVNCEGTDWVELVNTSSSAVDLSGWLLTDDPLDSARADHRLLLPGGTTIGPLGSLVVEKSAAGFPFGVKCGDDTIRLADGANTLVDEVVVPALGAAVNTWGRYPNGTGVWQETAATRAAPNAPAGDGGGQPTDEAAWLFEPGHVVEIDLGLSEHAQDELAHYPAEYVDGTFSLTTTGGTYGPYDVGVRLKGTTSFRSLAGKAAFKISFNHAVPGQRFLGLRRLTLNNMVQDPSMLREHLSYELFRKLNVPAPRTGNAFVRVNGADYGVYLDIETLDEVSLPRWLTGTRHLYEGSAGDDAKPGKLDDFEVDEGDEDDREDLAALATAAGAPAFSDAIGAVADLGELTRMWAVEHYIGHWDGYSVATDPNNYFLHSDAAGRFTMLPWGADQTWAEPMAFDSHSSGVLFTGCLADLACRRQYRAALVEVGARVAELDLDARATSVAAALAPWQQLDPRREQTLEQIAGDVGAVRAFVADRPAELATWLAANPPPADPDPPVDPPVEPPVAPPALTAPAPVVPVITPAPPAAAVSAASASSLVVGRTIAGRAQLVTSVRVASAGVLTQTVTARLGDRVVALCSGRAAAARAGMVTLRCPLTSAARRLRLTRTIRVTARTRLAPAAGAAQMTVQTLVLRRIAER